ncbi:methyl-accepting chemotaxis protein [Metabacillus litoralis]|uniref:Chemotaxis protein n=1 Tax=Metabacillus litoralis TaxID=152268 RepID=A0A179T4W3_9BACI|nr:HAMP domain-containing methyl-accepting chemotaxis protein [Metabacillus litoralis]OAS87623.1 chemotaxis protein [Metabacillus litoralis]
MKHLRWKNTKIGGKYFYVFLVVAITFLLSIIITFSLLKQTSQSMKNTLVKNEIALYSADLVSLYHEKYNLIPEYILLSDDKKLLEYLEDSREFVSTAKKLKQQLDNEEQLAIFHKIIENNHKLDEYFFSTIVPKVKQINTAEFNKLQNEANAIKVETTELSNQLKEIATESNKASLTKSQTAIEKTIFLLVISGVISLLISVILLFVISKRISAGLNRVVLTSEEIANGNLNFKPLKVVSSDEIGQLSQSINHMGTRLREMILEVSHIASDVDSESATFAQSSSELKQGSSQVAHTIEELATGVNNQANEVSDISENIKEFSNKLVEVNQDGSKLVQFSDEVLLVSVNGDQQMKQSLEQMKLIHSIVERSVEKIKNLETKTQSITELVTVIKSIAEQTNLLSLNASIEAARAGESGKGFAVVASEVKKLANEVSSSIENITSLVTSIKEETTSMSNELYSGFQKVNEGTEQIQLTGQYFSEIKDKITDMTNRVKNISSAFNYFEKTSHEINQSVEHIAAISEESAAGSEEISAAVYQQTQSIDNISTSAYTLSNMVVRMNEMISKFKV